MGKSIGIDLGTTNSVVAFKDTIVKIIANKEDGGVLTRSCVALPALTSEPIVGNGVYENLNRYLPNAVFSVKRLMGGSITDTGIIKMKRDNKNYPFQITNLSTGTDDAVAVVMQGKEFTPEEISAIILKRLKDDACSELGDVTHAVITVPAYFNEKQRTATRMAAFMAGFKVQRLISEPTAAAISYGIDNISPGQSKVVLIYDFGGGTFDLSILVIANGQHIEAATGGDRWIGGDDINKLFNDFVLEEFCKNKNIDDLDHLVNIMAPRKQIKFYNELNKAIESAKKQLTVSQNAKIELYDLLEDENGEPLDIDLNITREKFESIIFPLINRTIALIDELLEKSGYPIETIDNILLVGGSSGIPLVKKLLEKKYGIDKILSSNEPMLAIAKGAAILAHSLNEEFLCPNCGNSILPAQTVCGKCNTNIEDRTSNNGVKIDIVHTTKHNYFIQTIDVNARKKHEKIIDFSSVLPLSTNKTFKTTVDNQKIIEVAIFADAENGTFQKQFIGYYAINDNLPKSSELNFSFDMDLDETLSIRVCPKGQTNKINIALGRGNKDSSCMELLSEKIRTVFSSEEIPDYKKNEFMDAVQLQVEEINKLGNNKPDNKKWFDIESKIIRTYDKTFEQEDNKELNFIFAQILISNYSDFIDNTDTIALTSLIEQYENANNEIQKQELLIDMEAIIENYFLLIRGFTLKIKADQTHDVHEARTLNNYYSSFLNSLRIGDYEAAISVLKHALTFLKDDETSDFGTGIRYN